ncbi:hypothetical protein HY993_01050 [Candidatus Micrarchaeota archaeon]|nr:hypothetical protein [Candidatus Micrarchaeota archaeon]
MIAAILFWAAALVFGTALGKKFVGENKALALIAGCAAGAFIATLLTLALSLFIGLSEATILFSTALLLAAFFFLLRPWEYFDWLKKTGREKPDLALLAVFFTALIFFGLLNAHSDLRAGSGGYYSSGSTWGDLPFHASLITFFTQQVKLEYPIFAGHALGYYFGFDFLSSILVKGGMELSLAIAAPNALYSALFACALYLLAVKVSGSKKAAAIALMLVFFTGGLGFLDFLNQANASGFMGLDKIVSARDFSRSPENGFEWSNIVVDLILPQRSAAIGFAAALSAMLLVILAVEEKKKQGGAWNKKIVFASLLLGLTPLFHATSAVVGAFVCAGILLLKRREWLVQFLAPAGLLALPQVGLMLGQAGGFVRFAPGWMFNGDFLGWLWFWLKNAGPLFVLALAGVAFLDSRQRKYLAAFAAIFITANLLVFQPWAYDNTKFLVYALFAAAISAGVLLSKLGEEKNALVKAAIALILLASIFSGALSVSRQVQNSFLLYSNEEISLAKWISGNTEKNAVFLSDARHNSVLTLAGRSNYLGYSGWLWTHGINWRPRAAQVQEMLEGRDNAVSLIKENNLSYALVQKNFGSQKIDYAFFEKNFAKIRETQNYFVYKLK